MIQPEELYRILHQKPFRPLRVHVKDGRTFDVKHERTAVVGRTFFHIGVPSADYPLPICEYVEMLDLPDIDRVEILPEAAAQSG